MINIHCFLPKKYKQAKYKSHGENVFENDGIFYSSISFQQEPELGEGKNPRDISQYPLEDILDRYGVWVSDFYKRLNKPNGDICYLELASRDLNAILALQEIMGKHVYNNTIVENGITGQTLVIE